MNIPSDTPLEIEELQLQLLREKTPAQRFALACQLTNDVVRASKRAIARAHPSLTAREVGQLFIELHYGRELADAVREYEKSRDHG